MYSDEFIAQMTKELLLEKAEVEKSIAELAQPELQLDNPDVDDLANDAVEDILQGSSLSVLNGLLEKINRALARLKDGTYGICQETGQLMPEELLYREPWAEVIPPIMRDQDEAEL